MPPARSLNLRGGSVSPTPRTYDTSVIKVEGEVFDRDGYRMDVTVWFRHRNEVLYYLDSGGTVHGPMDQKHSTRLGNISRSGQSITGSRYYLADKQTRHHSMRRQSESGAWDMRSETRSYNLSDTYRGRTFSETRRPLGSEGRYPYQQQSYQYRSTATHNVPAFSPSTHISRWSSMQSAGTHGLWRGANSSNRYATTLTRQHIKRYKEPVEMVVKHPPSAGPSKVDLVSVDTRRESLPQISYSPGPLMLNTYDVDLTTERERRLQDELMVTRRELQDLRRSRSLTGDQHALLPPASGQNLKSTSTQYLDESSWTTHTLKRNEGQPCGARLASRPYRASSQVNVSRGAPMTKNQWISESNLQTTTTTYKQPPIYSTYSAHRENLRRREEEQKRNTEEWQQSSVRQVEQSKTTGGTEVLEEMETITLQPIGRGVHDLEPTGSIARSFRANTPTDLLSPGSPFMRPHSSAARLFPSSPALPRANTTQTEAYHAYREMYNQMPESQYGLTMRVPMSPPREHYRSGSAGNVDYFNKNFSRRSNLRQTLERSHFNTTNYSSSSSARNSQTMPEYAITKPSSSKNTQQANQNYSYARSHSMRVRKESPVIVKKSKYERHFTDISLVD